LSRVSNRARIITNQPKFQNFVSYHYSPAFWVPNASMNLVDVFSRGQSDGLGVCDTTRNTEINRSCAYYYSRIQGRTTRTMMNSLSFLFIDMYVPLTMTIMLPSLLRLVCYSQERAAENKGLPIVATVNDSPSRATSAWNMGTTAGGGTRRGVE
jgi:hypothetical protein